MKYYYGYISDGWGFVDEEDSRHTQQGLTEIDEETHSQLLEFQSQGKQIVYYNGEILAAEPDVYFINQNHEWEKRTDSEIAQIRAQRRREKIQNLSMTRGDVFEALILSKGVTKQQLRQMIENYAGLADIERALYLNRFDEALEFYRKHPAIDLIGGMLGISAEQMDRFFESKDWRMLNETTEGE